MVRGVLTVCLCPRLEARPRVRAPSPVPTPGLQRPGLKSTDIQEKKDAQGRL